MIFMKKLNIISSINQWFICNLPNAQKHIKLQWHKQRKQIGQLKQEAAKGPPGHQVKQSLILLENSAVWRKTNFEETIFNFLYSLVVST